MQVHVLASGSTGNSLLLKFDSANILVDAGISARRITKSLESLGTDVRSIDGVVITHEHTDHISGLTTLMKKYRLPVYARPDAWEAMAGRNLLPSECCLPLPDSLNIGGVKIEPFEISHDAAAPVGFTFYEQSIKCSVATDLGFVTEGVKKALALSDILVLESNHDLEMLRTGGYPWYLKRRIMSNRGHLSNVDAGWALARLARRSRTQVLLAHLSQNNNRPELARETVAGILDEQECSDIELHLTYPDKIVSVANDSEVEPHS